MTNTIAKFSKPATAKSFIQNAFQTSKKSYRLFLGDDDLVWVVTMREGEKLLKDGYTEISAF